jgi:hypothetical protein
MDFDLAKGIAILERTPVVVRDLLGGLPTEWTSGNEGPATFSPFDVVGHLIDGEETDWMVRARIILAQGPNRRFEPFDRFRHQGAPPKSLAELIDQFAELRRENLAALKKLDLKPAQFKLTGEHPELGTVTLSQLLATWVAHDLSHLAQIARVMTKQYKQAVGPWIKYLPVMTR